jgi:D-threonate/D-erythronate kinase
MKQPPVKALECLIIADDLTGACDAAVHFAKRGYRTTASVSMEAPVDVSVAAVNADTRNLHPEQATQRMQEAAAILPIHSTRLVFKKIDSTLRGQAGREVAAAAMAFDCDAVIFTPAFPALGRVVRSGYLCVNGERLIEMSGWLHAQGVSEGAHVGPNGVVRAIVDGVRFVSLDAESDRDLDAIVEETLSLQKRILWAGSGGLASALARAMPSGHVRTPPTQRSTGPVLFCIGSDHPATLEQQTRLLAERPVKSVCATNAAADEVAASLSHGEHVLLRIPRGAVSADMLRGLVVNSPAAAVMLSGGDTASAVCDAVGARFIELDGEIAPGIPRGVLRGGSLDGRAVVTKSGGFGVADSLHVVADFFLLPDQ